ncbi:hypothetical protein BDZ91DRAFT_729048 [Kalaharituber pfeilii]|nr:hypothetical protein BDZ91DRAFT_729048 [Kalaharituber pfeilii]
MDQGGRNLHLITLTAICFCAEVTLAADSAIGSSSDTWATLVANIAPLLILLGEKHVKAYFKVMCQPSHYLLYAAGPIGLITAITTLIRLNGTRTLKRLIGRQFETRAEVLADVTSVSAGDVSFQLDEAAGLEQTIMLDKDKRAFFYLQGAKNMINNQELMEWWMQFAEEVTGSLQLQGPNNTPYWFVLFASFRAIAGDEDDSSMTHRKSRVAAEKFATETYHSRSVSLKPEASTCAASAKVYAGWAHVSLPLTASLNFENVRTETIRLAIVVACLLGNIGVIIANWTKQKDIQNTALVSIGLTISTCGAFFVARLVDKGALKGVLQIERLDLSNSKVGFYSEAFPSGLQLSFCPKKLMISIDTAKHYPRNVADSMVVVMTVGYVALYLGLRTSEWWASLALLGLSAIASLGRALLVNDGMVELSPVNENDTETLWDFDIQSQLPGANGLKKAGTLSSPGGAAVPDPGMLSASQSNSDISPVNENSSKLALLPATSIHSYETLVLQHGHNLRMKIQTRNRKIRGLRWTQISPCVYLAMHLRKQDLVPVELTSPDLVLKFQQDQTRRMAIIFSDIICKDGIWRQPLETLVEVRIVDDNDVDLQRFVMYLTCWFQRARGLRKECYERGIQPGGTQISSSMPWTRVSRRSTFPRFSEFIRKGTGTFSAHHKWDTGDYVWTGAKLAFVCLRRYSLEALQRLADDNNGWAPPWYQKEGPAELDAWIEFLKSAGLVADKGLEHKIEENSASRAPGSRAKPDTQTGGSGAAIGSAGSVHAV